MSRPRACGTREDPEWPAGLHADGSARPAAWRDAGRGVGADRFGGLRAPRRGRRVIHRLADATAVVTVEGVGARAPRGAGKARYRRHPRRAIWTLGSGPPNRCLAGARLRRHRRAGVSENLIWRVPRSPIPRARTQLARRCSAWGVRCAFTRERDPHRGDSPMKALSHSSERASSEGCDPCHSGERRALDRCTGSCDRKPGVLSSRSGSTWFIAGRSAIHRPRHRGWDRRGCGRARPACVGRFARFT